MEEVNMKAKTILTGIVTAALTFSLETMSIFAAAPAEGRNFIDSNNDGICDNCGMYCQFIDEDGDGICDYYNNWGAYGRGLGYVDADGDGICDYFISGGRGCNRRGRGGNGNRWYNRR